VLLWVIPVFREVQKLQHQSCRLSGKYSGMAGWGQLNDKEIPEHKTGNSLGFFQPPDFLYFPLPQGYSIILNDLILFFPGKLLSNLSFLSKDKQLIINSTHSKTCLSTSNPDPRHD
jgi:hypothetical protein